MNLEYVKEFLKNSLITQIPCNLDYIAGVITQRGDFVTVIDLKKFIGVSENGPSSEDIQNKNSIITIETEDFKIGILVDKIFSIIEIPEEMINMHSYKQSKFIFSELILEDKLYTILDMKNILSDERFFVEDFS